MRDDCDGCNGTIYPEAETLTLCASCLARIKAEATSAGIRKACEWIKDRLEKSERDTERELPVSTMIPPPLDE